MSTIGIDIGATKINFVLLKNRKIVKFWKILTPKNKKELINCLRSQVKQWGEASGIGIGVPSPLNQKRDLILNPPNLKCLRNTPLARIIQREIKSDSHLEKVTVALENDVNCFTLGEAIMGAGKRAKIVFGITLGSGVGGGIVIDGKIYRGAFGGAAEVGHQTIKFDGQKCTCGSYGCFEEYCSERFFIRKGNLPIKFQRKAEKGDKKVLKIYNEYGRYLGIGLSNVINFLDPEVIVIGGGIANAYQFFIKEAKKEIKKRAISPISKKNVKIKKAELGDFSGAIGAALLIK